MLALFEPANIPRIASLSWYLVPLLVLSASLLGSTHCLGMCGGITLALPPDRRSHVSYHLGRLLGYLTLGAIAGLAGDWLLASSGILTSVAAVMMASLLIWSGIKVWRGQALHLNLPAWFNNWLQKPLGWSLKGSHQQAWLGLPVGLLTMFLPCGWLYTFVLGALLTRNVWLGATFLFCFWLGTVPLLALGPGLVQAWLKQRSPNQRRWVASLFVLAGLLTIGFKSQMAMPLTAANLHGGSQEVKSCHGNHMAMPAK